MADRGLAEARSAAEVLTDLRGRRSRSPLVGLAVGSAGVALATSADRVGAPGRVWTADPGAAARLLADVEAAARPRWVWWSSAAAVPTLRGAPYGLQVRTSWDLAAAHRLLAGGWQDDPATVWAGLQGLDPGSAPVDGQLDLLASRGLDERPTCATRPRSGRCWPGSGSICRTPGHGGSSVTPASTQWSMRCSRGAKPSASRRPTATGGWTGTLVPTDGSAVGGPAATAEPVA